MKKKIIAIALCAALAVGGVVAGSLAWLQDESDVVTNTFTAGDINIKLEEHELGTDGILTSDIVQENSYKMIPGATLNKDPFVTVEANSEKSYLFLQVQELNEAEDYLQYTIDTSVWTSLGAAYPNVYYCVADATTDGTADVYNVLTDKIVTVYPNVTKDMMDAIDGIDTSGNPTETEKQPELKFKAFAVQYDNYGTAGVENEAANAADAWENAVPAEQKLGL